MQNAPLVTIICMSYNHAPYVEESIFSIVQQSYKNIETIIIDDASNDSSVNKITSSLQKYNFKAKFIALSENIGNCKAFNLALKEAKGKYIIDLAADDIILPNRIKDDVETLEQRGPLYGAVFSDVSNINAKGDVLKKSYFQRTENGTLISSVREGDVYERILQNPPLFSAPSITYRADCVRELKGYDETLAYEDFDFFIRLSRKYFFAYYDKINTYKRILQTSHSQSFYKTRRNTLLKSTLQICIKAKELNNDIAEDRALSKNVAYHQRLSFFTENFFYAKAFFYLLCRLKKPSNVDYFFFLLSKMKLKVNNLYRIIKG